MSHLAPILMVLALIGAGIFARRKGLLTEAGTRDMARVLVAVIYPALILTRIPRLAGSDLLRYGYLPLAILGIALIGLALGGFALRVAGAMAPGTRSAFLFHCLVNNYLFLPLPIVQWLFGDRGVALLFYSSLGYEVTVWTLGVLLYVPGQPWRERWRNVFSPPLIALLIALLYVLLRDGAGLHWPRQGAWGRLGEMAAYAFDTLGRATIGVSMLVAGSRIAVLRARRLGDARIWLVSAIRLLAVPAVVLLLLARMPVDATARGVILVVATMPAAVSSAIFVERYGGDAEFVAAGLLMTHLWAVVTVPLFLAVGLS